MVVRASSDLLGKCVEREGVRAISVWRLSKSYIVRRPAGTYAHMPADSLDGRQSTLFVGQASADVASEC
jgi:hypothetical protein